MNMCWVAKGWQPIYSMVALKSTSTPERNGPSLCDIAFRPPRIAMSRDVAFSKITWHNCESTFPFQSKYQKKTRDDAEIVVAIG